VFNSTFKQTLGDFTGYLDTFEAVIDSTKIQFSPQKHFFDTTESWAAALQQVYGGADAKNTLDDLAKANTSAVNA